MLAMVTDCTQVLTTIQVSALAVTNLCIEGCLLNRNKKTTHLLTMRLISL